jgi:hypothetical protein
VFCELYKQPKPQLCRLEGRVGDATFAPILPRLMFAPPHQRIDVEKAFLLNTSSCFPFPYITQNCQKWLKSERKTVFQAFDRAED